MKNNFRALAATLFGFGAAAWLISLSFPSTYSEDAQALYNLAFVLVGVGVAAHLFFFPVGAAELEGQGPRALLRHWSGLVSIGAIAAGACVELYALSRPPDALTRGEWEILSQSSAMGSVFFQQLGVRPDPHEAEEPGDHADSVIDLRSTSETWEWLFGLVAVGALAITLSAAPPAVHDRWASIGDQIEAAIGANVDIVVFGVAAAVVAYLAWVGICKGLDWLAMSRERRQLSKEYPHG